MWVSRLTELAFRVAGPNLAGPDPNEPNSSKQDLSAPLLNLR
jgi:hypothetical protein